MASIVIFIEGFISYDLPIDWKKLFHSYRINLKVKPYTIKLSKVFFCTLNFTLKNI